MSGNMKFIELDSYVKPKLTEKIGEKWVRWQTQNGDNYFNYIIDRYHGSPTNNAIIQAISDMIYGKGIDATDRDVRLKDWAKFKKLFKDDEVRKVANDFKTFNKFAFQVIYSTDRKAIAEIYHAPVNCYMPEKCNEYGEIEAYWFSPDWTNENIKPKRVPVLGKGELNEDGLPIEESEIIYYQPYSPGSFYFSPVDYQGGLQYAEMEEGIADFHLNHLKNGFHDLTVVNFNNGVPDDAKQVEIESQVKHKFSGTQGQRVIVSFNESKETAPTIDSAGIEDADKLFDLLSKEASQKLMISHRITSPMLLGIKDNTGLGNNADELKTAYLLMESTVCRPYQDCIIEVIQKICAKAGISLDLYFKPLKPLEFATETAQAEATDEQIEKEEGVGSEVEEENLEQEKPQVNVAVRDFTPRQQQQIQRIVREFNKGNLTEGQAIIQLQDMTGWSEEKARAYLGVELKLSANNDLSDTRANEILKLAGELGEVMDLDEYELYSEAPAETEQVELRVAKSIVGYSEPDKKSEQDRGLFKIRYAYAPETTSENSRDFCKQMVALSQQGVVYRKEDIDTMSNAGVNGEFSASGQSTYDLFKFKGGAQCHHYWMRKVYMRKRENGKFLPNEGLQNDKKVSVNEARRKGVEMPQNSKEVATRPVDMPNNGRLK
jgi:hypothetical protein